MVEGKAERLKPHHTKLHNNYQYIYHCAHVMIIFVVKYIYPFFLCVLPTLSGIGPIHSASFFSLISHLYRLIDGETFQLTFPDHSMSRLV